MTAWLIVIGAVVAVVGLVVVLTRQGSAGRLSEEHSSKRSRSTRVAGRPAGPDAEAMAVGAPGEPLTAPPQDRLFSPPSPPPPPSADAERPVDPDLEGRAEVDRPAEVGHDERAVPEEDYRDLAEDDEPET